LFGIGGTELAIILLFAFLVFGPDKMPEIARTLGQFLRQFQNAQEQMNKVIKEEVMDPLKDLEPLVNPFATILNDSSGAADSNKPTDSADEQTEAAADGNLTSEDTATSSEKPSSAELETAIQAEAKQRRIVAASSAAAPSGNQERESFAARKARLEAEYAASLKTTGFAQPDDDSTKPESTEQSRGG